VCSLGRIWGQDVNHCLGLVGGKRGIMSYVGLGVGLGTFMILPPGKNVVGAFFLSCLFPTLTFSSYPNQTED
jgi:hypothetical protein